MIPHSLQIIGAGAATTIINGRGVASPIINSNLRAAVTARGIALTGGGGPGDGGGLYNCMSIMTLIDVTISGNTASRGMGNLGYSGGIYNCPGSSLTIINSALTDNAAARAAASIMGSYSGQPARPQSTAAPSATTPQPKAAGSSLCQVPG